MESIELLRNFITEYESGILILNAITIAMSLGVSITGFILSLNQKGTSFKKVAISAGISIILIIIGIIVALIFYQTVFIFFKGDDITNIERLSSLSVFCSTILGFVGTYIIFIMTKKRENEKERMELNSREEHKKEYNKDMLYTLLKFTVSETQGVIELIFREFMEINCRTDKVTFNQFLLNLKDEDSWLKNSLKTLENPKNNKLLRKKINTAFINNLIYDNNWTNYLEHEDINVRVKIIIWINTLRTEELNIGEFIKNRDVIVEYLKLIDKYSSQYNDKVLDLCNVSMREQIDVLENENRQLDYKINMMKLGMTNVLEIKNSREILKAYIEKLKKTYK